MLVIKKKKSFKYPLFISLILSISLGCIAVYKTFTKTYNKITNESDDLIVKGASKTGEISGKLVTAFGKSAYDGAGKILKNKTIILPALKEKGIEVGKIILEENNVLQVYVIFNDNFKGNITIRVKDINNEEVGRATNFVEEKIGTATYLQFNFNRLTDIQDQSTIFLQ